VGASAILVGSFVAIGSILRINARLINVQSGKVINAESVQGRVGPEIFDLMDQIALSMETQLVGSPEITATAPSDPEVQSKPEPQPKPEPPAAAVSRRPQAPATRQRRSGLLLPIIILAGAGGAYYYYTYVLNAPSEVDITVNIEP
ncbi:MAG: hypothetical protein IH971_04610, partial [Candidatus Marinimicrobia bacterium]|nr:hypothetical protein [Candidatus Neomarinimicrobiota bacterium]